LDDPRFADQAQIQPPILAEALQETLASMPYEEVKQLVEDRVSGTVIRMNDLKGLLAEPQIEAIEVLKTIEGHKTAGPIRTIAPPWSFDDRLAELRLPAPVLGQHTADVLGELGYDKAAIAGFVRSGAVAAAG